MIDKFVQGVVFSLCISVCFLLVCSLNAQQVTLTRIAKIEKSSTQRLDDLIEDYQIVSISADIEKNKKAADGDHLNFVIPINKETEVKVDLESYSLLASNYQAVELAEGDRRAIEKPNVITLKGQSQDGGEVRLTMAKDYLFGYFEYDKDTYYIEPALRITKNSAKSQHIVYNAKSVKNAEQKWSCASIEHETQKIKVGKQLKTSGCALTELAIALDYLYVQKHGGSANAIVQSLAVLNMVQGDYSGAFSKDIKFEVVTHLASSSASSDPWTNTTDPAVLLNSITSWGPSGFGVNHDLGTLWTGRDLCFSGNCSVAGLAWISAVCTSSRYSLLEDFTSVAWALRVLASHEMGHNYGANHDATSGNIMAPSVGVNTSTWSAGSKTAINSYLPSYTCLSDCLIGSCTNISNVSIVSCTPGSPSTYSMSLKVDHGDATGSGFKVHVNGQVFNQSWAASPQDVVITGLIADGTLDNLITINANDGSDSGCSGSITYDEPSSTCSTSINYDFDNCALPANWTAASTNVYSWNGGDPLLQYEWRFDDESRYYYNYDAGLNASTSKTIDGSCMAYFDDDIVDHTLYTGVITLSTPSFNLSSFDNGVINFDYLFHSFENSFKPQNASSFKVDIWNGSSWTNILNENNSPCVYSTAWTNSCIESKTADITPYLNSEFKVRFVYTDGNTGSWTGTVAIDNFSIQAGVTNAGSTCGDGIQNGDETGVDCGGTSCVPCNSCQNVVTISSPQASGIYEASQMVNTIGNVTVGSTVFIYADNVELGPGFTVANNAQLTIESNGCDQ